MAEQLPEINSRVSRRKFLVVASLGLGAAAALAGPLKGLFFRGEKPGPLASSEFPGEDSIFHPRRDPRQDAAERRSGRA